MKQQENENGPLYPVIEEGCGHGFAATKDAIARSRAGEYELLYVLPRKIEDGQRVDFTDKKEYENAQAVIVRNFAGFLYPSDKMVCVPFEERHDTGSFRNFILETTSPETPEETLHDIWRQFFSVGGIEPLPLAYPEFDDVSEEEYNVLFIPQKYISDGGCGANAISQSVPLEVFDFLKQYIATRRDIRLHFGQHFHKTNDLEKVDKVANEFRDASGRPMYIVGRHSHEELLGLRGIQHYKFLDYYRRMDLVLQVASTPFWFYSAVSPDTPQVVIHNLNLSEPWEIIGEEARAAGYPIWTVPYDPAGDLVEFAKRVEKAFYEAAALVGID